MGADRQAQQDSHSEIHQLYPINSANSRHINNIKARQLKFCMGQAKIEIQSGQSIISVLFSNIYGISPKTLDQTPV